MGAYLETLLGPPGAQLSYTADTLQKMAARLAANERKDILITLLQAINYWRGDAPGSGGRKILPICLMDWHRS